MIYSPNFALFLGKHLISPFLGGTTLHNLGEISQNTYVLLQNVAFLVYAVLRKFSLKKAAYGKLLTYSKSDLFIGLHLLFPPAHGSRPEGTSSHQGLRKTKSNKVFFWHFIVDESA